MRRTELLGIILIAALAALASGYLWQRQRITQRVDRAIQANTGGETARALEELETLVGKKGDPRLSSLYVQALVEEGLKHYEGGQWSQAYSALSRAGELAPEDEDLKKLLASLTERLALMDSSLKESRGGFLETVLKDEKGSSPKTVTEVLHLLHRDRLTLEKHLHKHKGAFDRELESLRHDLKKTLTMILGLFALAAVAGAGLVILVIHMLRYYTNRAAKTIMKWMEYHTSLREDPTLGGPHSEKIAVIEAELILQPDPTLAKNLLGPYLTDENPWVKARATKAMHRVRAEPALQGLLEIWQSGQKQAQLAALWALAEIGDMKAVESLIDLTAQSIEEEVKKSGLRHLLRLKADPRLPAEAKDKIEQCLKKIRETSDLIL